jgi:hypothetical protein
MRTTYDSATSPQLAMFTMPVPITATIQRHPWDLWGLANLFDGTDSTHTHVKAQEPKGRPSIDTTDPKAVARFRAVGYDISATLISDELVWQDDTHKPDLRDMREAAESLLARVNVIGHFLDPEFVLPGFSIYRFRPATAQDQCRLVIGSLTDRKPFSAGNPSPSLLRTS